MDSELGLGFSPVSEALSNDFECSDAELKKSYRNRVQDSWQHLKPKFVNSNVP